MQIFHLAHDEIDKKKWDERIAHSGNGLIYATSVYLDYMSTGWQALVTEDYDYIMPLPVSNKLGIRRIMQPAFCQQLGIFSDKKIDEHITRSFITKAGNNCDQLELFLNSGNHLPEARPRKNLILNLNHPFEEIKRKFRKDLITKSIAAKIIYLPATISEVIALYKQMVLPKNLHLKKSDLNHFNELCKVFDAENKVMCRKVVDKEMNILSAAIFLKDDKRVYYLMSANNESGRKHDANAFLLHEMIREVASTARLFDFEGSQIPGVRFFFQKFSPEEEIYPQVSINRLTGWKKRSLDIYHVIKKFNL